MYHGGGDFIDRVYMFNDRGVCLDQSCDVSRLLAHVQKL